MTKNFHYISILFVVCFADISVSQNWLPMDKGLDCFYPSGYVRNIVVDSVSDKLYISGVFNQDGNCVPMRGMAKWNGQSWDSIGNATEGNVSKFGMKMFNDTLYLSGNFYNDNINFYLAKWNGNYWDTIPNSPNAAVWTSIEKGGILYMGGFFDYLGNDSTFLLGKYDGTQFSGIVPYCDPPGGWAVYSMAFYQDTLYVGGYFNMLPCKTLGSLAKWDGNDLQLVSAEFANNGANCAIQAMVEYQGELYMGGYFLQANGYAGNHIMKWNGTTFSDVGGGMNNRVTCMKVYNGELYVGGSFTQAGSVLTTYVAKWDGTNWHPITTDIFTGGTSHVEAINVYHDTLIIGGHFYSINGNTDIRKIAKYNYALTEIKELHKNDQIIIYPNPAQTLINIEFENASSKNYTLSIVNVLGQTVYSKQTSDSKLQISVDEFPSGIYVVQMQSEKGLLSMKFVKQ